MIELIQQEIDYDPDHRMELERDERTVKYIQDLCSKCGMFIMVAPDKVGKYYCQTCAWDKMGEVR